jgi:hypothetical protein
MRDQKFEATISIVSATDCDCFVAGRVAGVEFLQREN